MSTALVVPCFNESARWNASYWGALFTLPGLSWLLVDDGSTDDTYRVLDKHASNNVSVLRLSHNAGKGEAVRQGLEVVARDAHDWVGFVDADGAFKGEEIQRFVALALRSELSTQAVWSSRVRMRGRRIERSPSRHAVGRSIATALSVRYWELPYDSQAGLKLFRNLPQLSASLRRPFGTRWLFDVELYSRLEAQYGTGSQWLWEEPLDSWQHIAGSKISLREIRRIPVEIMKLLTINHDRLGDR